GFDHGEQGLDAQDPPLGSDTAEREAIEQGEGLPVDVRQHSRRGLAASVEMAVATIAEEATDADELLYRLLVSCLDDHRGRRTRAGAAVGDDRDGVGARREVAD